MLKGHNGKIKSLYWSNNDSILISCGSDGAIYTWNVKEFKREHEFILKSVSYTSAVCSADGEVVYAVGSDKTIKVKKIINHQAIIDFRFRKSPNRP